MDETSTERRRVLYLPGQPRPASGKKGEMTAVLSQCRSKVAQCFLRDVHGLMTKLSAGAVAHNLPLPHRERPQVHSKTSHGPAKRVAEGTRPCSSSETGVARLAV